MAGGRHSRAGLLLNSGKCAYCQSDRGDGSSALLTAGLEELRLLVEVRGLELLSFVADTVDRDFSDWRRTIRGQQTCPRDSEVSIGDNCTKLVHNTADTTK